MNKILASVLCILIKNALFIYRNPLQLKRPLVLFVAFTSCTMVCKGARGGGGGGGERLCLGPRSDVYTTCKLVTLQGVSAGQLRYILCK